MANNALSTCPFCDKEPCMVTATVGYLKLLKFGVACGECAICIGWFDSRDEAARRWNTRSG